VEAARFRHLLKPPPGGRALSFPGGEPDFTGRVGGGGGGGGGGGRRPQGKGAISPPGWSGMGSSRELAQARAGGECVNVRCSF